MSQKKKKKKKRKEKEKKYKNIEEDSFDENDNHMGN